MLTSLRIGPKLLLAPALGLALLMLLAGGAWYGMARQHSWLEHMVQVRAERLRSAADTAGEAKYAHAHIYQLLAWINGSFARARLEALEADMRKRHAAVGAGLETLGAVAGPQERELVEASAAALQAYRNSVAETLELAQVDLSIAANAMQKADRHFTTLNSHLQQLAALEQRLSEDAWRSAREEYRTLMLAAAGLVLLSIALSLLVTFKVRRAMLADVRSMSGVMQALAQGRLDVACASSGRDEIADTARALDQTIGQLNATLRTVQSSVRTIGSASREIASGNLDLSARTDMQASALEKTAGTMDALTSAVRQNADHARSASELASGAAQLAGEGGAAMQRAVAAMDQIKAGSGRMADIIGVIDAISFQTNILALNAAVEAARAGEQGRGFAVVAAEVRTLAQRSAGAAREIRHLIGQSIEMVDSGGASVHAAGRSMGAIVASVQQLSEIVERISSASAEQADGIAEVNLAVMQMDGMTQQNAALVEEAAAAAASLSQQTAALADAVAVFRLAALGQDEERELEDQAFHEPEERRAAASPMRLQRIRGAAPLRPAFSGTAG